MKPRRVLMVCLGNICRSPVAQGLMEAELLEQLGPNHGWTVDSAGTSSAHRGEAPDPRSQASVRRWGLSLAHQASRPLVDADFENFDHILVMDRSNLTEVLRRAPSQAAGRVSLMLDASFPGEGREVPDPYYGGEHGFEHVALLLRDACRNWMEQWRS